MNILKEIERHVSVYAIAVDVVATGLVAKGIVDLQRTITGLNEHVGNLTVAATQQPLRDIHLAQQALLEIPPTDFSLRTAQVLETKAGDLLQMIPQGTPCEEQITSAIQDLRTIPARTGLNELIGPEAKLSLCQEIVLSDPAYIELQSLKTQSLYELGGGTALGVAVLATFIIDQIRASNRTGK